jgi:hypothetical protein
MSQQGGSAMRTWDENSWHLTLTKTQDYVHRRIRGDDCDSELIMAWRSFYHTHDPVVRLLVSQCGLVGDVADACIREAWIGMLSKLNKLNSPLAHESFLYWLSRLVRSKIARVRRAARSEALACCPGGDGHRDRWTPGGHEASDHVAAASQLAASGLSSRLYEMSIVEERSVDDVAAALGLTPEQVATHQHQMMDKILTILIKLDT